MSEFNQLLLEKMSETDVTAMTVIMKKAFDEDTRRHLGIEEGGPPDYDNGGFIRKWYLNSGARSFKVLLDGKLIGGLNVFINDNRENYLGNLYIDPLYEDNGYGTLLWKMIERMYPDTIKWKTDTKGFSKRNHHFYINKCGFKVVKIENPKDKLEENYILEKEMGSI
ncbi:MAG: GNAT family N-acetyltransferase [Lachnospiraceae bacterium]